MSGNRRIRSRAIFNKSFRFPKVSASVDRSQHNPEAFPFPDAGHRECISSPAVSGPHCTRRWESQKGRQSCNTGTPHRGRHRNSPPPLGVFRNACTKHADAQARFKAMVTLNLSKHRGTAATLRRIPVNNRMGRGCGSSFLFKNCQIIERFFPVSATRSRCYRRLHICGSRYTEHYRKAPPSCLNSPGILYRWRPRPFLSARVLAPAAPIHPRNFRLDMVIWITSTLLAGHRFTASYFSL